MAVNIGILLDVSDSMQSTYEGIGSTSSQPWAISIFQVMNDLIKHDVSSENRVFALAFGGTGRNLIFDILGTMRKFQNIDIHTETDLPATIEHTEELFSFLERHGARTTRKWVNIEDIRETIEDYILVLVLHELRSNKKFRKHFVQNILPPECRNWDSEPNGYNPIKYISSFFACCTQNAVVSVVSQFRKATKEEIESVADQTRPSLLELASWKSILSAKEALRIIHGSSDNTELTLERSKDLYRAVKPFIFGDTPLYQALEKSKQLFTLSKNHEGIQKILFVLSDGYPTDMGVFGNWMKDAKDRQKLEDIKEAIKENTIVVCCFISKSKETRPKKLYSRQESNWSAGARFLFDLSSTVPTQLLPRAILMKRGWEIDIEDNETRLFMEVNHPENIRDTCDLARNAVCSQDALSELLVDIALDVYINQRNKEITASTQEGGTCYAYASATVLHLSMKRILGRDNGYPDFIELREELIQLHGREGAYTLDVLQGICPKLRLRCKEVKLQDALKAITEKRPIVATFFLAESEWNKFDRFYAQNPIGILSKKDIDIQSRDQREKLSGHAVVLTSFNSQCLRLMNSWGERWGDMGFFRVQSADVLDLKFIDVYWKSEDLSKQEKRYFKKHGPRLARELRENLMGLQGQTFQCPLCVEELPIGEFQGSLRYIKCPACKKVFHTKKAGNRHLLALNMYLTSVAR